MPMDTSVKVFNSAQAGAPVVGQVAGSLIAMLDACLVDGYGLKAVDSVTISGGVGTANISTGHSAIAHCVVQFAGATGSYLPLNGERKVMGVGTAVVTFDADGLPDGTATGSITLKIAPAGWQKVFSGTNKAVYRSLDPASTQVYLRVDDTHAQYARPSGFLTMADVDSGTGGYASELFWNRTNATAGSRPWWVVANRSMLYFGVRTHGTTVGDGFAICAFGDLIPRRSGDAYRCVIAGSPLAAISSSQLVSMSALIHHQPNGLAIARAASQLGNGVWAKPMGAYQSQVFSGNESTLPFPNQGDNSVVLSPAECADMVGSALRGRFPGLYFCPQSPNGVLLDDFEISNAADFPGRTLLWKLTGDSGAYGGCAIDVTGPWA